MILYNPDNGATIRDISYQGTLYFTVKDGLEFKAGDVVKIEDDEAGEFIKETYGFIQEVSVAEAKEIKERKERNQFKCDKCDYTTDQENKLKGHSLHHSKEEKIDKELGIRVVSGKKKETKKRVVDGQAEIDAEADREGLIGEGLTRE